MEHMRRVEIAGAIANVLRREQRENLLYVGIQGSTSRNEDRLNSDLDVISVFRDKHKLPVKDFWVSHQMEGISLGIGLLSLQDIDVALSTPNGKWPYFAYKVIKNTPVYFALDIRGVYAAKIALMPQHLFIEGATIEYLEASSGLGKIKSNAETNDLAMVRSAALMTFCRRLDNVVALINRDFLEGDYGYRNLQTITRFNKSPDQYVELSERLWLSNNINEIVAVAEELWKRVVAFAKENGLDVKELRSLENIFMEPNGADQIIRPITIVPISVSHGSHIDTTKMTYDKLATWWGINLNETLPLQRQFMELRQLVPRGTVLDAGCGTGRDTTNFINHGYDAIGADFSDGMLEEARRRHPTVPFVRMDLRSLTFKENTFDAVWSCGSMHHIPKSSADTVLSGFNRVLKVGGVLFVTVVEGHGERIVKEGPGHEKSFAYYTEQELKNVIVRNGFEVIDCYVEKFKDGKKYSYINIFARSRR